MNRSLEVFTKLYKPYKITKNNNVYIFYTMDGNYAIKLNTKIDYKKLYDYLLIRNFSYIPLLIQDSREDVLICRYEEDFAIPSEQKALDLINLVTLLHAKTCYYKRITNDTYKEIYECIFNNLKYSENYYNELFLEYLNEEYNSPSHYLLLRNFSLINNAINFSLVKLDEWFNLIKDKEKQRVVLVHNNIRLEHMIKNNEEYLISWDSCKIDTPVLDLYKFYLNEWENVSFKEVLELYNNQFELLDEEKMLFYVLISIPFEVSMNGEEIFVCRNLKRLINFLNSSSKIIESF